MTEPEIESALRPVIEVFEHLGIDYRIGGSVASTIFGVPRSTIDADIACALLPTHIDEMVNRLSDRYYIDRDRIRDSVTRQSSFNLIHLSTMIKVDVFMRKSRSFDQECFRRVVERPIGASSDSRTYRFVTAEDIILLKLEWYCTGGEVSERQWSDVLGVLKVQQDNLDLEYLQHWSRELEVDGLLARALHETGLD